MKKLMGRKSGDTLVEVTLAIGIFSMVAIATVSVVNTSTSDAQANLETTVTREVIDAQAEALRFLQSAYNSGGETGNTTNLYSDLWKEIIKRAITPNSYGTNVDLKYDLNDGGRITCDKIYKDNGQYLRDNHAFVLNLDKLGGSEASIGNVIKTLDNVMFSPATSYPHLVYNNNPEQDETLLNQDGTRTNRNLSSVEGIFIIPVKDPGTFIVGKGNVSAYYDFYIRTCWYGPGADIPSTISTVIRLYNPELND